MLTEQEKNSLYSLITAMVGDAPTIRAYKANFNGNRRKRKCSSNPN